MSDKFEFETKNDSQNQGQEYETIRQNESFDLSLQSANEYHQHYYSQNGMHCHTHQVSLQPQ